MGSTYSEMTVETLLLIAKWFFYSILIGVAAGSILKDAGVMVGFLFERYYKAKAEYLSKISEADQDSEEGPKTKSTYH